MTYRQSLVDFFIKLPFMFIHVIFDNFVVFLQTLYDFYEDFCLSNFNDDYVS